MIKAEFRILKENQLEKIRITSWSLREELKYKIIIKIIGIIVGFSMPVCFSFLVEGCKKIALFSFIIFVIFFIFGMIVTKDEFNDYFYKKYVGKY